jgi:hypothetical protein
MRAASPSSTVASVAGEQLEQPGDVVREVEAPLLGGEGVEVEHLPGLSGEVEQRREL